METTQALPGPPAQTRAARHRAVRVIGLMVLIGWVVVIVASLGWGYPRTSTFANLKADVAAGRVTEVQVTGGLRPHAHGYSVVELRWRKDLIGYSTSIVEATGVQAQSKAYGSEVTAVVDEPVAQLLRAANSHVHVSEADIPGVTISVFGWNPPDWVSWLFAAVLVTSWGFVIAGPEPRRATRWAWFWLVFLTGPVGSIAYLLLSGVLTGTPFGAPCESRGSRLTGGWALVLALAAAAGLGALA